MIVCSCAVITDAQIEQALTEILRLSDAPLPTPGVVYRHLRKKMVCCGCSPLAVSTIYQKIDALAQKGVVCPYACESARGRLRKRARKGEALRTIEHPPTRHQRRSEPAAAVASSPTLEPA